MAFLGLGPNAWMAVGRTLGMAIAGSVFGGRNSVAAVVAREIQRAITRHDLELAKMLLRDMQWRHEESLKKFIEEYGDYLPPEFLDEFKDLNS